MEIELLVPPIANDHSTAKFARIVYGYLLHHSEATIACAYRLGVILNAFVQKRGQGYYAYYEVHRRVRRQR